MTAAIRRRRWLWEWAVRAPDGHLIRRGWAIDGPSATRKAQRALDLEHAWMDA